MKDRSSRTALVLALIGAAFALASAAAAESSQSSLAVEATVLPTCLVSTGDTAGSGQPAAVSCDNFGDGSIAIEQDRAAAEPPAGPVQAGSAPDSPPQSDVTYVTISY